MRCLCCHRSHVRGQRSWPHTSTCPSSSHGTWGCGVFATVDVLERAERELLQVGEVGNVQRHLQLQEQRVDLDGARLAVQVQAFVQDGQVDLNGVRFLRPGLDGSQVGYLGLTQDDVGDQTLDAEVYDLNRHEVLVGDVDEVRDLHVHHVGGEVDHDRQHGHRRHSDAPREEEEEDQTADQEAHGHGDAHVQPRVFGFQPDVVTRYHGYELVFMASGNPSGSPTRGAGVSRRVPVHGSVGRKVLQHPRPLRPFGQIRVLCQCSAVSCSVHHVQIKSLNERTEKRPEELSRTSETLVLRPPQSSATFDTSLSLQRTFKGPIKARAAPHRKYTLLAFIATLRGSGGC